MLGVIQTTIQSTLSMRIALNENWANKFQFNHIFSNSGSFLQSVASLFGIGWMVATITLWSMALHPDRGQ